MEWQWHQLDHMQIICTSLQTDNHASTSSLDYLQAGCSSWCPANSVKALKATFRPSYSTVMVYDDADDRRFAKRIMQNASTALRVPVRCEEVSLQRWSKKPELSDGSRRWWGLQNIPGPWTCNGESLMSKPTAAMSCGTNNNSR